MGVENIIYLMLCKVAANLVFGNGVIVIIIIYKCRKVHLQTINILQVEQAKIWDATLEERTLHME